MVSIMSENIYLYCIVQYVNTVAYLKMHDKLSSWSSHLARLLVVLLILQSCNGIVTTFSSDYIDLLHDELYSVVGMDEPDVPEVVPPPLCSTFVRPDKAGAISQMYSRFEKATSSDDD